MWQSPGPWQDSNWSKPVEVGFLYHCLEVSLVSAKSQLTKFEKQKNYRECSNIKADRSVHWQAQFQAIWQRGCTVFQHPAGITPTSPSSLLLALALTSYQSIEKHCIWLVLSSNLELIFCMQEFHCRNAQVENQGQTRYIRILDSKPYINTYCCILHSAVFYIDWSLPVKLKFFLFSQFLLYAHQTGR